MRFLVLLMPFIAFFGGYITTLFYVHTKTVVVPTVVGKSLYQAVSILGQHNLGLKLLQVKEDTFLPEGTVISQVPQQGQLIKPSKAIFVIATKKPKPILVPLFLGQSIREIFSRLEESSISAKLIKLEHSENINSCFAQYPAAGADAFDNKMVIYTSSGINKQCLMPSLIGQKLKTVRDFLISNNINFEIVDEDSQHDNMMISDQSPMSGTIINLAKNLNVQLKISAFRN